MKSGVVSFNISGRVDVDQLLIETGKGDTHRTQRIKLTRPPMIGAGMGQYFKFQLIRVGETFRLPIFDPSTMAREDAVIKVVGREPVKIDRITYNAFRLETAMWGSSMTFWYKELTMNG